MIIDRKTLFAVVLADIFVMFGAMFIMWDRLELASARVPPTAAPEPSAGAAGPSLPASGTAAPGDRDLFSGDAPLAPVTPAPMNSAPLAASGQSAASSAPVFPESAAAGPTRRIRFSYRNSKPLRVEIIGDFNKWQPQAMTRGKNFEWNAAVSLRPGEYTYNFIVDGRVIRDPNNPRTASEGRSLLTVKPLTE